MWNFAEKCSGTTEQWLSPHLYMYLTAGIQYLIHTEVDWFDYTSFLQGFVYNYIQSNRISTKQI